MLFLSTQVLLWNPRDLRPSEFKLNDQYDESLSGGDVAWTTTLGTVEVWLGMEVQDDVAHRWDRKRNFFLVNCNRTSTC